MDDVYQGLFRLPYIKVVLLPPHIRQDTKYDHSWEPLDHWTTDQPPISAFFPNVAGDQPDCNIQLSPDPHPMPVNRIRRPRRPILLMAADNWF